MRFLAVNRLRVGASLAVLVVGVAACSATTSGRTERTGTTSATGSGSTSGSGSNAASAGARLTDPDQATKILADANNAIETVNSYDYRTLSSAYSAGLRVSTGRYRDQYTQAFKLISANASKQRFSQRASVTWFGLGPIVGNDATVLVVGRLAITKSDRRYNDPFTIAAHVELVGTRWLLSQVDLNGSFTGVPAGTPALTAAVSSARVGVQSLLTLRRAHLADDYGTAIAHTTGALRADLERAAAQARAAVTNGGYDLVGRVSAVGVVRASGASVDVLVAAIGYREKNGRRTSATRQSLEITLVRSGSGWLLSKLVNAGAS